MNKSFGQIDWNELARVREQFDALLLPADYDREMLWACSCQNAADVPNDGVAEGIIATAKMYIDQRDMAEEALIIRP